MMDSLVASCWIVGLAIAVSGIDDALVDSLFHWRNLLRRRTVYRHRRRCTTGRLPPGPARPVAILVPAWNEEHVIAAMLRHLRATQRYAVYHVFVGVYPNNRATEIAARAADPAGDWLTVIRLAREGPTSKGDCLNVLWRHAVAARHKGRPYELFVLHDAEDIVDPEELIVFDALADRADMLQLPVFPMKSRTSTFVNGHYVDEFAESHQKDMALREALTDAVPCAGVGCAFGREALDFAAQRNGGCPFDIKSMTEDYSLSLTLAAAGRRSIFIDIRSDCGRRVATRGCFPHEFLPAVKQKARWLTGITLQAAATFRWVGPPALRYMLWRDRKALTNAFLNIAAYCLVGAILLRDLPAYTGTGGPAPLLSASPALAVLFGINAALMLNRAGHRAFYVARLYGRAEGARAILRMPMSNAVNFAAAVRAIYLYGHHLITGQPLKWDKTDHEFPALPAE